MAVAPVDPISSPTSTPEANPNDSRIIINTEKLKGMTASEILDGYNNKNWAVPDEILNWAKTEFEKDPNSKITYGESGGSGNSSAPENDAVEYQATLEEQGMSLKDQCKEFTKLSAEKEVNDLNNVTKMAPYTQNIPQDEVTGNNGESAVVTALNEINKELFKNYTPFGGNSKFRDGMRFFKALKEGTNNDLTNIDTSLEEMSAVINGSIVDAKDSRQYGEKTVELGKELKSNTKWWQFFGSRRKASKRAIEQGGKTISMSDRTKKLAEAVAKDNQIALNSIQENINIVDESNVDENNTPTGGNSGETTPTT